MTETNNPAAGADRRSYFRIDDTVKLSLWRVDASELEKRLDRLEHDLDGFNADLPRLKEFILPGGGPAAAACHLARTIARRAERRVFTLSEQEDVRPEVMRYLNRLSDLLFVVARVVARAEKGTEVLWNRERS